MPNLKMLKKKYKNFENHNIDIRNFKSLKKIFKNNKNKIKCISFMQQPNHHMIGQQKILSQIFR